MTLKFVGKFLHVRILTQRWFVHKFFHVRISTVAKKIERFTELPKISDFFGRKNWWVSFPLSEACHSKYFHRFISYFGCLRPVYPVHRARADSCARYAMLENDRAQRVSSIMRRQNQSSYDLSWAEIVQWTLTSLFEEALFFFLNNANVNGSDRRNAQSSSDV